ncbi:MAG: cytochrome b/b6 domain-containing protein [Gammaproteobacteria bacterium]|jgi:cytochrome b
MKTNSMVKVWDPLVRVFHWSLVLAFFTAYITEDDFLILHTYAGYTVLGLILFRIIWGIIGTRHARFSSFVTSPGTAWQYIKDTLKLRAKRYLGHNPAGGAMIILLLVSLLITTLSGMATYGAVESAGPLGNWLGNIGESGEDMLEEVHEFFANFTVMLVAIHVGGVIIESLLHRENLVRSMLHGYKTANPKQSGE